MTYPPNGQNVWVTTTYGSSFPAYWDGSQWWVGVPEDGNDLPIRNDYVASWRLNQDSTESFSLT